MRVADDLRAPPSSLTTHKVTRTMPCEVDLTSAQVLGEQREIIAAEARSEAYGREDPQKAVGSGESAED